MKQAPIPENEKERLASLKRMDLLSTAREGDFDRVTRTAQKFFQTEIALVSLIDEGRQWFKARCGLDVSETPRDISFCGHAIMGEKTFVVENAFEDERFADNPLVTGGPEIRFYAGHPLTNQEGYRIGTLCIISPKPRTFSEEDGQTLRDLGRMIEIVMENRALNELQTSLLHSLENTERDTMIDPLTGVWNREGFDDFFSRETSRALRDGTSFGVAYVDLDHLKKVNEAYGEKAGDDALKLTASILVDASRATDVVARMGSELFALIIDDIDELTLPSLGEKYLRKFRRRAKVETEQGCCNFTVSMGMVYVNPAIDVGDLQRVVLDQADEALLSAKKAGRDCFKIKDFQEEVLRSLAIS
ncbi:Diguanylate cyclase [Candidatus Terasakiella magnetica]|uniref:Diguanylate cyclase n=1 Tax=Candidatus Terasakiella magnetica TaxID=1867952 RepID=A0A1C3RHN5_9PROT|nr:sensor domain-containing diguanylate cyclase [Candidatus Terasakiella magnetica]SCA56785.1 Diguanylate cyclase [Candidatus Terasakiella magnetica]